MECVFLYVCEWQVMLTGTGYVEIYKYGNTTHFANSPCPRCVLHAAASKAVDKSFFHFNLLSNANSIDDLNGAIM